jgi:hypothetical protein
MVELTNEQKAALIAVLREFKPLHPWQGTTEEKQAKWNTVTEKIGEIIGKNIHYKFVDDSLRTSVLQALANGEQPPEPDPDTFYMMNFSMITLLNAIAKRCLEASKAEAEFFAVELFSTVWPKLFAKLVAIPVEDGCHIYMKAEDAERYRQAQAEMDQMEDEPMDGGDDFGGMPPQGNA